MKKTILISILLSFKLVHAQSLPDFLVMEDQDKITFLNQKAALINESSFLENALKQNASLQDKVNSVGKDLANLWGDTILEGPYVLVGPEKTELTEIYVYDNQTYAYGGRVKAPAVFTEDSNCTNNPDAADPYEGCSLLNIYEDFYMDASGKFIISDYYPDTDDY